MFREDAISETQFRIRSRRRTIWNIVQTEVTEHRTGDGEGEEAPEDYRQRCDAIVEELQTIQDSIPGCGITRVEQWSIQAKKLKKSVITIAKEYQAQSVQQTL